MSGFQKLVLKTEHKTQMINITEQITDLVIKSGVKDGVCTVFTPHTTGGVLFFEKEDPNLGRDFLSTLKAKVFQDGKHFSHVGDNAAAHLKSAVTGASVSIIVSKGQPLLGQWQGVFFAEFDGPREAREVYVKVCNG